MTAVNEGGEGEGSLERSATPTGIVGGLEINTFNDVEFLFNVGGVDYGRLFSLTTGIIYKDGEINETTGFLINIAFGSSSGVINYF